MARDEDVPQSAGEALAWGWSWLRVECARCRHRRSLSLGDFPAERLRAPLASFTGRLYCGKCRSRDLRFALGAHAGGTLIEMHKALAFEDGRAVHARRD